MMGGFGIGMLLWVALIVFVVWWIAQSTTGGQTQRTTKTSREVLDERLARGEITIDQYRELRKALE